MKLPPANLQDVWAVLRKLDARHLSELELYPHRFPVEVFEWACARLDGAVALWHDEEMLCVFGFDGPYTWFLATPAYYAGGLKVIRFTQRYLREVAKEREVLTVAMNRPDTLRWLALLGYEIVERREHSTLLRLRATHPLRT